MIDFVNPEVVAMQKKILAIDDEPDVLTFYSEVLEDSNYIAVTAESGLEGLAKARTEKPDLIILDIMMPKKSGMLTYKELKKDSDLMNIPVVIITAIPKEVDYMKLLDRGTTKHIAPAGHIVKPLTPDDLIKEVERVLRE
jgi:DNA-binding response OmpR family regulator